MLCGNMKVSASTDLVELVVSNMVGSAVTRPTEKFYADSDVLHVSSRSIAIESAKGAPENQSQSAV